MTKTSKINSIRKSPRLLKKTKKKTCLSGNVGKMIYNIKQNGVMLAHNYSDPKTGKKKNPVKGFPPAPIGWYLSEKYDGYRAIWDGKNFRSRSNNIFKVPEWFANWLPPNIALDGELFLGRENFQKCGIFRKKVPVDEEWREANVKYQIFDAPGHPGLFEERQEYIKQIIYTRCKCFDTKCPLVLTKQTLIKNEKEVKDAFQTLTKKGAEGIMLRAPKSPYEGKRTAHLLKYKQLFDAECIIIGYKNGSGKYKDMLGAFKCELVSNKKIKFDISGMNDEIRRNYRETHPVGTIVTFTYMGLSDSGVPRHPQYSHIRETF
jgi:DNA ligase 1